MPQEEFERQRDAIIRRGDRFQMKSEFEMAFEKMMKDMVD